MKLQMTAEELIDEFSMFDDWNEKYQYIIELGDQVGDFPDAQRTEENLVQGCQSNVWLISQLKPGDPPTVHFQADSDSQIVRGLIAILLMLMSGRTPDEIRQMDVEGVFDRLELRRHLSRSRSNGLHSMIKRMRAHAEAYAKN